MCIRDSKSMIHIGRENEFLQGEALEKRTQAYEFKQIVFEEELEMLLDFDEICAFIQEMIDKAKGPVLIYCRDGDSFSPGIAIAYYMYSKSFDINKASLLVFAKRSSVNINKKLYTQLMNYAPGKMKRVQLATGDCIYFQKKRRCTSWGKICILWYKNMAKTTSIIYSCLLYTSPSPRDQA
eukprot:TRINITY_DN24060_c0_g2_i1.p1 TRINITY_DN24060_c0_g2~~TRINITY_DN24060_c0_g2_i1.p1  ORF type:complete len:181 (-),score=44.63 TRINITY_DN24060_c0_g2_i1:35-577(-)